MLTSTIHSTETERAALRAKDRRITELDRQLNDHRQIVEQLKDVPALVGIKDPVQAVHHLILRMGRLETECQRLRESAVTSSAEDGCNCSNPVQESQQGADNAVEDWEIPAY